jgi:ABC-type sugar transport system permease subunit
MQVVDKFFHSFWFHMIVAAAIMLTGWWLGFLLQALIFNMVLWPAREVWQKRANIKSFFDPHVILEWATPMVVAIIVYGVKQ